MSFAQRSRTLFNRNLDDQHFLYSRFSLRSSDKDEIVHVRYRCHIGRGGFRGANSQGLAVDGDAICDVTRRFERQRRPTGAYHNGRRVRGLFPQRDQQPSIQPAIPALCPER